MTAVANRSRAGPPKLSPRGRASARLDGVLSTFEIEPTEPQRGTVIWMHGLGASNHDFDPVIPELRTPYLRFVFPAAPIRPVTINGGMPMPAWYDILSFDNPPLREKESDVREAEKALFELIERERERGVPPERVVLAGFSQGGAMALHVGLRSSEPLAGVLVLSAYLLLPQRFEAERAPASTESPLLFAHGRFDPVVPFELGRRAYERVTLAGYAARWAAFDMEHSLCIEEVEVIGAWLAERFAKLTPVRSSPPASTRST
jgi:phospholipase/carboxylesterase